METNNAVQLYSEVPNSGSQVITFIEQTGDWIAASGMFNCARKEQGRTFALIAYQERKPVLSILRKYHIQANGSIAYRADGMLADFRTVSGGDYELIESSPTRAAIKFITAKGKEYVFSLTWEQVKDEPFTKGKNGTKDTYATPWMREQMLWARLVSSSLRKIAPEIVAGTYTPEEVSDFNDQPIAPSTQLLKKTEPRPQVEVKSEAAKLEAKHEPKPESNPEPKPLNTPPPPAPEVPQPEPIDVEPIIGLVTKAEAVNGKLTIPTIQTLQHLIGEHAVTAEGWLKAKGHIKESFADMPVHVAQKIIDAPEKFILAIGGK